MVKYTFEYVTPVTVFMISFHHQNPKSLPVS
jgi:hypothetical protein